LWGRRLPLRFRPARPGWLSFHPTYRQRAAACARPLAALYGWQRTAWSAAALVLALDVMLVSPLASYHLAGYPAHFGALAIFLLVSSWLLPFIGLKLPFGRPLALVLAVIFGVRWAWLALNVLLLLGLCVLAPEMAAEVMSLTILSGARTAALPAGDVVGDPLALALSVIPGLVALQLLQAAAVLAMLLAYWGLQGRAAGQGGPAEWPRRHWMLVLCLGVAAVTLVLSPLSRLIGGRPETLGQPGQVATYLLGAAALVVAVGVAGWGLPAGRG
jgi:hypothetical protein